MFETEVLTDPLQIRGIGAVTNAEVDPVFGDESWLENWWSTMSVPGDRFRMVILKQYQTPVGKACLYLSSVGFGPIKATVLSPVAWNCSEYVGLHLPPRPELIVALFKVLAGWGNWDVLSLFRLPPWFRLGGLIKETAREMGWFWAEEPEEICPILNLEGTFQSFMASRFRSKFRNRIKRMSKRLSNLGQHRFAFLTHIENLDEHLDRIVDLERKSWKGRAGLGIFSTPQKTSFYRDVAQSLNQKGQLALHLQYLDDALLAYHFGFLVQNRFYDYNLAFDPEFESFSPGLLSLTDLVEKCFDLGVRKFDFLRGAEAYKKLWTDTASLNTNIHIFSPKARGKVFWGLMEGRRLLGGFKKRFFPSPVQPQFSVDASPVQPFGESDL